MNIKSLLIGSAALAAVSTGAQAADAIVVAEPEPMEYVRVCDVFGAGFYYIPGTETCLRVGGYMRYQINVTAGGFTKLARFAPIFDARSETEIGVLRGYAEVQLNWQRGTRPGFAPGTPTPVAAGTPYVATTAYGADVAFDHVFIEIQRGNGAHNWRFGRTHSPWSRFLGYALFGTQDLGASFRTTQEISYTFNGSNGFSFIAAILDDEDGTFVPDLELGFMFARGWGHVGLVGRGDFEGGNHGVKGSLLVNFGNSGVAWKTQAAWEAAAGITAVTGFRFAFTPKFAAYIQGGLLQGGVAAVLGADITLGADPNTPNRVFLIRPEVTFVGGAIGGTIRLNRTF